MYASKDDEEAATLEDLPLGFVVDNRRFAKKAYSLICAAVNGGMGVNMDTFGQKLKRLRVELGMSLEEMGRLLGTTKQVLSRYENDIREPKISTVTRYAEWLGINARDLLSDWEPPASILPQKRVTVSGDGKEKIYCIDSRVSDWLCDLLDHLEKIEQVIK